MLRSVAAMGQQPADRLLASFPYLHCSGHLFAQGCWGGGWQQYFLPQMQTLSQCGVPSKEEV